MSNVVDFEKFREAKSIKDMMELGAQWFCCKTCGPNPDDEYLGFAPLIIFDKNGPIVGGLVCNGCEGIWHINGGRLE